MRVLAVGIALSLLLAGCLGDPTPASGEDPLPTSTAGWVVDEGTWPSGERAREQVASYVMTHPFRVRAAPFTPFAEAAQQDLVALLEDMGLPVWEQAYEGGVNVIAVQNGSVDPDRWVVLSAHYDSVGVRGLGPTIYGAWDDGAGVATLLALAEAYQDWSFPFTVAYAFFDGEELGLEGSRAFVEEVVTGERPIEVLANINTDPPGLNWPCGDAMGPYPVVVMGDAREATGDGSRNDWLHAAVVDALDATGVPEDARLFWEVVRLVTVNGQGLRGRSDHASFGELELANVFLGGIPGRPYSGADSESPTVIAPYPLHTPIDTLAAMEATCVTGSLAGGLQTGVDLFTHTLVGLGSTLPP